MLKVVETPPGPLSVTFVSWLKVMLHVPSGVEAGRFVNWPAHGVPNGPTVYSAPKRLLFAPGSKILYRKTALPPPAAFPETLSQIRFVSLKSNEDAVPGPVVMNM